MLEIILIIIGIIAIFSGLYWYAFREMPFSPKPKKRRKKQIEPQFDNDDNFVDVEDDEKETVAEKEQDVSLAVEPEEDDREIDGELVPEPEAKPKQKQKKQKQEIPEVKAEQDEQLKPEPATIDEYTVIAFTIMARKGERFSGKQLKTTFEGLNFHFGEMQFYHRLMDDADKHTLFSVANILDPGTLNPDSFATMSTPGLLIFARFPSPMNDGELFEEMFKTARTMAEQLSGVLCDEKRQILRQTTLEDMRSRI